MFQYELTLINYFLIVQKTTILGVILSGVYRDTTLNSLG